MSIYFTGCCHINHKNIIFHCSRPFKNLTEMNDTIINNWNKVVSKNDQIYVTGDFIYSNKDLFYPKLNGQIITVDGDHDNFKSNRLMLNTNINGQDITIAHWPMLSWRKSHYGSWMIHSHHHWDTNKDSRFQGKIMNVGMDLWNFTPISFDQIKEFMDKRENNWNQLKKDK